MDDELDELLSGVAAVAIEGPKAVGKTATALQRTRTVHELDDPAQREIAAADPPVSWLVRARSSLMNGD